MGTSFLVGCVPRTITAWAMTKQAGYAAHSVLWPEAVCGARCAPYLLILNRNPHIVTRGKGLEQAEDIQAGDRQTGAPTDKHAGHLG